MAFKVSNNGTNNNGANTDEWFNNQFSKEQFLKACKDYLPKTVNNIVSINDNYMIDSKIGVNISQCVDVDLSTLTDKQKACLLEHLINTAIKENSYRNGYLKTVLRLICMGGWNTSKIAHSTTTNKGGIKL